MHAKRHSCRPIPAATCGGPRPLQCAGKTTIRLQMETAYTRHNEAAIASGKSKGHFVVDITKPGHMTACLTTFMETIKASTDNWDAAFSDQWLTADLVDCILSYAVTELVRLVSRTDERARAMLDELRCDPKACRQFLLLSHLYARTDASTLAGVRAGAAAAAAAWPAPTWPLPACWLFGGKSVCGGVGGGTCIARACCIWDIHAWSEAPAAARPAHIHAHTPCADTAWRRGC